MSSRHSDTLGELSRMNPGAVCLRRRERSIWSRIQTSTTGRVHVVISKLERGSTVVTKQLDLESFCGPVHTWH